MFGFITRPIVRCIQGFGEYITGRITAYFDVIIHNFEKEMEAIRKDFEEEMETIRKDFEKEMHENSEEDLKVIMNDFEKKLRQKMAGISEEEMETIRNDFEKKLHEELDDLSWRLEMLLKILKDYEEEHGENKEE